MSSSPASANVFVFLGYLVAIASLTWALLGSCWEYRPLSTLQRYEQALDIVGSWRILMATELNVKRFDQYWKSALQKLTFNLIQEKIKTKTKAKAKQKQKQNKNKTTNKQKQNKNGQSKSL